jgi:hypothetical protein
MDGNKFQGYDIDEESIKKLMALLMMTIKKANNCRDQITCMKLDIIMLLTHTLKRNFLNTVNKKSG